MNSGNPSNATQISYDIFICAYVNAMLNGTAVRWIAEWRLTSHYVCSFSDSLTQNGSWNYDSIITMFTIRYARQRVELFYACRNIFACLLITCLLYIKVKKLKIALCCHYHVTYSTYFPSNNYLGLFHTHLMTIVMTKNWVENTLLRILLWSPLNFLSLIP